VGYAAYTVQLSRERDYIFPVRSPGAVITSVPDSITLAVENERLVTKVVQQPVFDAGGQVISERGEQVLISDLLRFFDGGDAGDVTTYDPPRVDVIAQADLMADTQVESAALYDRLILHHRLRVAPSLRADHIRVRGLKLIDLTTTATLYTDMPGVYFHTTFENSVADHRLRAHLKTGIRSEDVLADSAFGVESRRAVVAGPAFPEEPNLEGAVSTYPMHSLCAVQDESAGMALLARGLPEFEAVPEDGQLTLALTLVRAVGWLSRGDVRTRTAALGPTLAVPGAQCQRAIAAEYALIPTWPNDPTLLRTGCEFSATLQVYQYSQPPEEKQRSYLSVEGEGVS
jgi:alpha-mannosidase/mannosylglycerate hydrolase